MLELALKSRDGHDERFHIGMCDLLDVADSTHVDVDDSCVEHGSLLEVD